MNEIKNKIIIELKKPEFPDLNFLFSKEVLDITLELLGELLNEEKDLFTKLLQTKKEDITFEVFDDEDLLDYFWSLLNHYQNVNNTDVIRDITDTFRPQLQDFGNYVAYNRPYFEMLEYCNSHCELDQDQKRAMHLRIKAFKDRGINLDEKKQDRLKELNKILSELSNAFSNNIVDDEARFEYIIEDIEPIKNLPVDVLENTKNEAKKKEKKGYLFSADPTAYIAIMKYCSDSEIREDFEKAKNSFASKGKYDNRGIILDILKYKREKAQILGYKNYAELSLNDKMADSPEQVFELIEGISGKAKIQAEMELDDLKKYFDIDDIQSYDLGYFARKLKEEKYSLDEKELKKYFEYENVLEYLHDFVKGFYGLELKEVKNPIYNENVKMYEVYKGGKLISYYFLDAFYRKEKRGGAWADNLREKNDFGGNMKIPVVVNVCNFQKSEGKTLLTMRDVETIFHEFGHAIHEMLSESKLSELSGFGVEWDFVELPSQILENWVTERESLEKLGKHFETAEPISKKLLDTLDALKTFMMGGFVLRQNEFALLDMNLYVDPVPSSVKELDKKTLSLTNKFGLFTKGEDYKMYTSFGHIFGGGYAAGYYSYMWAEIIEADVFAKIKELGMFDEQVGEKFIKTILGQGTRKPADELFFDFMGRKVQNTAFLKRKGL
ncbi:M3 family metallopeptidase [Candidatus Gracilibacteria bacterium 28_42_T64]|nr:M3 family metallopeptidase [Candidatus Gracilibacteria bacterium 28_42_T64]